MARSEASLAVRADTASNNCEYSNRHKDVGGECGVYVGNQTLLPDCVELLGLVGVNGVENMNCHSEE